MAREYSLGGPLIMADLTPYKVDCNSCRKSKFLTLQEYQKQLDDTKKEGFVCLMCGSDDCSFDEENYKRIMKVERKAF